MISQPYITVQLVHIQGPLKGKIQDLNETEIIVGRHPNCHVQFPKDQLAISRQHARIVREGNRFKLIDESTNGSYINGKRLSEAYLKDGDVITFAEGGPKVSFLTQISDQPMVPQPQAPRAVPRVKPVLHPEIQPAVPQVSPASFSPVDDSAPIQSTKAPLAIQFGPALKSFDTLPITLGTSGSCDFVIQHPAVSERHAQIFFSQDRYWIKDLTGMSKITINHMPIQTQAPLSPNMQLSLSEQGPKFRFIAGGRLAEIEDFEPEPTPPQTHETPDQNSTPSKKTPKKGNLFKRFFS